MDKLQTLLGIELPLIQAPMAGAQSSALAIAVSNAGDPGSVRRQQDKSPRLRS